MNEPIKAFFEERNTSMEQMAGDAELRRKSVEWMIAADRHKYVYNFTWMGRPVIKYPNDIVAQQELIWELKPDLIIETGVAHGGSLIFLASMLELIGGEGRVLGIDIDIRPHNRAEIEKHPMSKRITLLQGSSTAPEIVKTASHMVRDARTVLVILDSLHSHAHVLDELRLYTPFVSVGSYCVVADTFVELFPKGYYPALERPWDVGDNPMTAANQFLSESSDFVRDDRWDKKTLITEDVGGYLRRLA